MTASPLDSHLTRALFGDDEAGPLFSDGAELRAMLLVEGALAKAQGALGLIPAEAAGAIHRAARETTLDPAALGPGTAAAGLVAPPFVEAFRAAMQGADAAAWIHHGATSQDIMDTGLTLRLRRALDITDARLLALIRTLGEGAAKWRDLPMAARTRAQVAMPTTFGARIAAWGAPLLNARERLAQLRPRVLLVSLAGAAGTNAAMGPKAGEVARLMAEELGLSTPDLPWHSGRDGLSELASALAIQTGGLGKFGRDLILLGQSEIGEVRAGQGGGSSTMPHKSNPVGPETLVALARLAARLSGAMHDAVLHESERDGAAWALEWMSLPQIVVASAAALRHAGALAGTLAPDPARMAATMAATGGLMLAEAVTFRLARTMPRPEAQALVKRACADAALRGVHLADALEQAGAGPATEWMEFLDPMRHVGQAPRIADRFAERAAEST